MKTLAGQSVSKKTTKHSVVIGILILVGAALAVPFYSAQSGSNFRAGLARYDGNMSGRNSRNTLSGSPYSGWQLNEFGMPVQETIETFAADCTTPRSTFYLGETVCAKTDSVDLNYPGGRWVDWILTGSPNTIVSGSRTTTLIITNPQTFTHAPAATGVYKVEITQDNNGQDDPQTPAIFTVVDAPPVVTYGYNVGTQNCTFPRSSFVLGETVCVKVEGAVNTTFPNKIAWADPDGLIRQKTEINSDPMTDSFELPSTATSLVFGGITVDNRGTWRVDSTRNNGRRINEAQFTVSDPAEAVADVFVEKFVQSGDAAVAPGGSVAVTIVIGNRGPDSAANVNLIDSAPSGATLSSFTQQSGPTCTEIVVGSGNCTIATLINGSRAEFKATYNMGASPGTFSTSATVSSDQVDSDSSNNSATTSIVVAAGGGGGSGTCNVGCPDDITTPANTTQSGNPGAIVHFSPPSGNDECGTITVDHCNDCFFPEGSTTVTATASTGDSCSFIVTVTPAGSAPAITCPSNQTGNADSSCQATFSLGTATASGQNVTVVAFRSDGKPVYTCDAFGNCTRNSSDAPFNAGTTTITWYAYAHDVPGPYTGPVDGNGDPVNPADTEEGHRNGSATCTQTVTVNDVTPPTITAVSQTVSADANCQAVIPDYHNSANDNCACASDDNSEVCQTREDIVVTQDVAAGTSVGLGTTTIHLTATDEANNVATKTITFTVVDTTAPTFTFVPSAVTANTGPGATTCDAVVDPGQATATDNCGPVTITRSPSGNTFPVGTTTITWTAKDGANNTTTANQTVTVIDNTPPQITCNADIVADYDAAVNGATVTYTTPVGTDNCASTTTQIAGLASGSVFPPGTTTNTFRVTDASGNTASCSFKVTVAITSVIGLDSATLGGSALLDSYNSSGGYPATKGSLANLLSNGTVSIAGSSKMFGNVRSTRVGVSVQGTSQVNGNATAGTTVSKGASAVITGTTTNNALAPVMTMPSVVPCTPFSSNSGISGTYSYNSSTGDLTLSGINVATLANGNYCFHNVTLTNSGQLKVNGPVVIKLTGTFNAGGASTVNNTTLIPANLRILSSFSGSNGVIFSNGNSAYLLIYAPTTSVSNTGSAPLFGEIVGKSITLSNSGTIHYDTQLKSAWPALWPFILAP